MLDLLHDLKRGRTWRDVAEYLGGQYTGAFWRLIATGERHATLEQTNLVRAAYGLPALTQSPAEAVKAAGVDRVVYCSKRPNTAILAAVSGGIAHVTIRTGAESDDASRIPVTLSYSHATPRAARLGSSVPSMSELAKMPQSAFATIRGKTGNLAAIAEAASRAAEAMAG